MFLADLLKIKRGIFAAIGSGGKTTLLSILTAELSQRGRVIVTTTTHIYPPAGMPLYIGADTTALGALLAQHNCVAVGLPETGDSLYEKPVTENKLIPSVLSLASMQDFADYVLIEADGSRSLPMKAHAPHEPVLPTIPHQSLYVLGASGFGKQIAKAAHRPELFAQLANASIQDYITPALAARVLVASNVLNNGGGIFINQCETAAQYDLARSIAEHLRPRFSDIPCFAGTLQKGEWICLTET